MKLDEILPSLAVQFALMSLMAVGGANTVLPEMHRFVVDNEGWMTHVQFAEMFGIAQAAPGPNMLFVTMLGWKIAGFPGALAATLAMTIPTCALTWVVYRAWDRFKATAWRELVQAGLVPVTAGLVLATGYVVTRAADGSSVVAHLLTVAVALLSTLTRVHPLAWIACGAALGMAGAI